MQYSSFTLLYRHIGIILLCFSLSNCSSSNRTPPKVAITPIGKTLSLKNESLVIDKLYQQLNEWQGTPYLLGGLSKQGIDCSGLVVHTYQSKLGYQLPRSTHLQLGVGFEINVDNLRAGDLVFFKTGFTTRHVGIYVEKGQFLHASTSQGVKMSRLNNVYWREKYWKALRVK